MANLTLKITSVEVRKTKKQDDYAYARGFILKKDGTQSPERTIMSFGPQFASVRKFLRPNRKIVVNTVLDKGVVKILGPKKETKAEKSAKAA